MAAALPLATPVSAAELLTNGGFERPEVTNPCCITSPPVPIPGWTVTPDVNVVIGTYGADHNLAAEGLQYLDLIGEAGTGSISQSFNTVLGQLYTLNFAYSHNLFSVGAAAANISIDGVSVGTVAHSSGNSSNLDWKGFTTTFAGTGASTTLKFTNTAGNQYGGLFLDAVSVAAVPEPASWALFIVGFGAMGGAMRRRSSQVRTSKASLNFA